MGSLSDRDKVFERLLRQPSAGAAESCVDGETLAAWTASSLRSAEALTVERHVSNCARCQALLATFVRTTPVAQPAAPLWRRLHLQWLVPLATAATVAAVWVALPPDNRIQNTVGEQRAFETKPLPSQPPTSQEAQSFAAQAPPPARKEELSQRNREVARQVGSQSDGRVANPGATFRGDARTRDERTADKLQARAGTEANEAVRRVEEGVAAGLAAPSERSEPKKRDQSAAGAPTTPAATAASTPVPPPPAARAPVARPNVAPLTEAAPRAAAAEPGQKPKELPEPINVDPESPLAEIVSPNPLTRWRITLEGVDYSSTGGKQWRRTTIRRPGEVTIGHSPKPPVLWLVGLKGTIYVTTNGVRFDRVRFVEPVDLATVEAIDDRQATVTAVDGRRFRTTDRGDNWTRLGAQEIPQAPF